MRENLCVANSGTVTYVHKFNQKQKRKIDVMRSSKGTKFFRS